MLEGYYNAGTATATAGSAAVVGQGTQWKARGYRTGDTFYGKDGKVGLILDVPSDTSITLLMPWGGTSQVAQSYAVQAQAPGVDLDLAVATLLASLNNGALAGIADAGSAANKLPYYTGPGQADLMSTGEFGRSLMAAALLGDAETTLKLGNYVKKGYTRPAYLADANAVIEEGQWNVGPSWVGSPFPGDAGANQGYLINYRHSVVGGTKYQAQIHIQMNAGNVMRFRIMDNGAWQPWGELVRGNVLDFYQKSNILGTVSQSGGVPTVKIIERSTSASGNYIRFADGTQICTRKDWISGTDNSAWTDVGGSFYNSISTTFPAAFVAEPVAIMTANFNIVSYRLVFSCTPSMTGLSGFLEALQRSTAFQWKVSYMAIGRWF